jgi:hypothetical protein
MIYKIYKETGRIGTGTEKIEGSLTESQSPPEISGDRISLAAFDTETNTIHIFNDKIVDVTSLVQKFKYYCDLPNNHQFSILYK